MPSPDRSVDYDVLKSFSSTSDDDESLSLINDEAYARTLFDDTYDSKTRISRKICLSLVLAVVVLITLTHRQENKANGSTAPRPIVDNRPYETTQVPLASDNHGRAQPAIAWLMSYPNSGTSYTMRLVQMVSNTTAATNYGEECDIDARTGRTVPLYDDSPFGPYLRHIDTRPVPEAFIITKTHCGGRCVHCPPEKYIESVESFYARCLTGTLIEPTLSGKEVNKSRVQYSDDRVTKAIHLVRDPINNVVARFHLEYNNHKDLNNFSSSFPNSKQGFRDWCIDLDSRYKRQENKTNLISPEIKTLFSSVPCHSEFYRYAQWHNMAIEVTEKMGLESTPLVVHYENYESSFEPTLKSILRFLKLDTVGKISPFIAGKTYHDYFQKDELDAAMVLIKAVASQKTWTLVRRYQKFP